VRPPFAAVPNAVSLASGDASGPGIVLSCRPDAGPVRAAIGADADQIEGLRTLAELGRGIVLEQHE
jgi:hypothetical protein